MNSHKNARLTREGRKLRIKRINPERRTPQPWGRQRTCPCSHRPLCRPTTPLWACASGASSPATVVHAVPACSPRSACLLQRDMASSRCNFFSTGMMWFSYCPIF
ncbi:MAG: hypothetical protein LBF91_04265 [Azoarcus sp.]|nr:hypothetical protein [Azoarcus sp.]